jgi:ABC-type antimicrobial peptide transport system permease subunit
LLIPIEQPEGMRYAVLFTYAEGEQSGALTETQAQLFGTAAAKLHIASDGFLSHHSRFGLDLHHLIDQPQGWKIGQPFTIRSPDNPNLTLTLVPKLELPTLLTARALFFDRRLLDEAVKNTYGADIQDRATFRSVRVDRAENMNSVIGEIDKNFHNSEGETETTDETAALNSVITGIGDVRTIMYSICIVVLLTVLLIAANSMAMMVRDRITEVAVMRALGFARVHVVALLLTEAALIGLSGGIVGAAAALWFFHGGISLGALTGGLGYMAVAPDTAAWAVLVALGVSLLSAVAPVTQAANIPPAMAFRKVV